MKFFSYLLVAALGFCLALYIVKGGTDAESLELLNTENISGDSIVLPDTEEPDAGATASTPFTTYYDQLTAYQKSIYDALLPAVATGTPEMEFTNVNLSDFEKSIFKVCVAIQYDHPEYFWFEAGYSGTMTHTRFEETGTFVVRPAYYGYTSSLYDFEKKQDRLMERVREIAAMARGYSNDSYEQIIFVHDYIIENAYYDFDGVEEYYRTSHNPSCEYIFSAYGCLVDGKTVCSGYAKAFQLILREMGFDCTYVAGDAGERHGWNCVYLDGEGYYVDITWDDADLEEEIPMYNYTFVNDEALLRTHTIDMDFDPPVCNATKYNYHIRNHYYLETYDFDSAARILESQIHGEALYLRFGSLGELGSAYTELIDFGRHKDIPGLETFTAVYYDEDQHTLTIVK